MGNSQKNPHLTPWLGSQHIARFFEEILIFYPLGIFWANWWVLFEFTHILPTGYDGGRLVGTFKKHPKCICQVCSEQIAGLFHKELTLYLVGSLRANWWVLSKSTHHGLAG